LFFLQGEGDIYQGKSKVAIQELKTTKKTNRRCGKNVLGHLATALPFKKNQKREKSLKRVRGLLNDEKGN